MSSLNGVEEGGNAAAAAAAAEAQEQPTAFFPAAPMFFTEPNGRRYVGFFGGGYFALEPEQNAAPLCFRAPDGQRFVVFEGQLFALQPTNFQPAAPALLQPQQPAAAAVAVAAAAGAQEHQTDDESEREDEDEDDDDDLPSTTFEDLIGRVRGNSLQNPTRAHLWLPVLRNDMQVDQLAQALRGNNRFNNIDFDFERANRFESNDNVLPLNWNPLLQVLECREMLDTIHICRIPTANRSLLLLFRDRLFQSLQRNPNIRSLCLRYIDFSNTNAGAMISYLDGATSLKELRLISCENLSPVFLTALQHNSNIESIQLFQCQDEEFVLPILQMLASPENTSRVTKISYRPENISMPSERVAGALQQCFQSDAGASIQSVVFQFHCFNESSASSAVILDSLIRSTSVKEVEFSWCTVDDEETVQQDSQIGQQVANLVRNKLNLETLRLQKTDFLLYNQFSSALVQVLTRPKSKLCCLDFEVGSYTRLTPLPTFRTLMSALTRASRLQRLAIRIDTFASRDEYIQALTQAIPLLKIEEFTIYSYRFSPTEKESLLEALKNNYVLQNVQCFDLQTQLEFCLNRNRKLAEWTANPNLIPRELWSCAMDLAVKAGVNSLYQSLIALSEHQIGLRNESRKRKRSHD